MLYMVPSMVTVLCEWIAFLGKAFSKFSSTKKKKGRSVGSRADRVVCDSPRVVGASERTSVRQKM
jgi:hypothetical protein